MSIVDDLERLSALFHNGTLSEDEYAQAKRLLLRPDTAPATAADEEEDTDPGIDEVTDPNIPPQAPQAAPAEEASIWTQQFSAGWLVALFGTLFFFFGIWILATKDKPSTDAKARVKAAKPIAPSAEQIAKRKAREATRKAKRKAERQQAYQRAQRKKGTDRDRARKSCESRYYNLCRDQRPHDSILNQEVCKDRARRRCR